MEVIWPGYDDKYNDYGYVTIENFDDIPEIPEQGYSSFKHHSAALVHLNYGKPYIISCGGGYFPPTNKCFGLNLRSGSWESLPSMNYPRKDFELLQMGQAGEGLIAIGGAGPGNPLIEIFNKDFNMWTSMPQWNGPFNELSGHCAVIIGDTQIMIIGNDDWNSRNTSMILDISTGMWTKTAPIPNARKRGHACFHAKINFEMGVLVTGGTEGEIDPNDVYPATSTDFYHIETDTWISLANVSHPVEGHQMVMLEGPHGGPSIIGGRYELFLETGPEIHMRNEIQTYLDLDDKWFCCVPQLYYKRSRFTAVNYPAIW